MSGATPIDYQFKHFRATVPERHTFVGIAEQLEWRYYDTGPKSQLPPLVCLGGVAATSDVFYKQMLALSGKGYRVLAMDAPALWTHEKWVKGCDQFLDALRIHQVHIYGTSLGGFLAQLYAQHRPRRVLSLVLSNTFLDTRAFHVFFGPWASVFPWAPDFVLKRLVLSGFKDGPHEPLIADSIDFVVARMDQKLSRAELASRLALNTQLAAASPVQLPDSAITIMDCNDFASVPEPLREALYHRYPEARRAFLKSGGDFPFLSRADEVNLHLLLHLRRVGAAHEGPSDDELYAQQLQEQHEEERASAGRAAPHLPGAASRGLHPKANGSGSGSSDNLQEVDRSREHLTGSGLGRSQSAGREDPDPEAGRAGLAEAGEEGGRGLLSFGEGQGLMPLAGAQGDPLGVSSLRGSLDPWNAPGKGHEERAIGLLPTEPGLSPPREAPRPAGDVASLPLHSAARDGSAGEAQAQAAEGVAAALRGSWGSDVAGGGASVSSSGSPGPEQSRFGDGLSAQGVGFASGPDQSRSGEGMSSQGGGFALSPDQEEVQATPQSDAGTPNPHLPGAQPGLDSGHSQVDADDSVDVDMGTQAREWLRGVEEEHYGWVGESDETQARDWLRDVENDH